MREVEEVVRAGGHPRLRTACMVPFLLRSRRSSCYSRISCRGSGLATGVGNRSRRRALITPKQAAVLNGGCRGGGAGRLVEQAPSEVLDWRWGRPCWQTHPAGRWAVVVVVLGRLQLAGAGRRELPGSCWSAGAMSEGGKPASGLPRFRPHGAQG
eukprot:scaffold56787_cov21-Tisochrysis_lutea.AAC.1